jgi:hypothetical protein
MTDFERKPHRVVIEIDDGSVYIKNVICPYSDMGIERPCSMVTENYQNHPKPPDPAIFGEEPVMRFFCKTHDVYVTGHARTPECERIPDPSIQAEWFEYWDAVDEFEPWVPMDGCWVREAAMENSAGDFAWNVTLEFDADWKNKGQYEDSELLLTPWQPT